MKPKKKKNSETFPLLQVSSGKKEIRGSGFTYYEDEQRTDKSIPIEDAGQDKIVRLPELGKKYRP